MVSPGAAATIHVTLYLAGTVLYNLGHVTLSHDMKSNTVLIYICDVPLIVLNLFSRLSES